MHVAQIVELGASKVMGLIPRERINQIFFYLKCSASLFINPHQLPNQIITHIISF